MLNKNTYWIGMIIGILLPLILYFLFLESMDLMNRYVSNDTIEKFQLVLIAINSIVMRQFMLSRKQENTGKGIFIVTFIGVIFHVFTYYIHIF